MAKAKVKTTQNEGNVLDFLQAVDNEKRKADSLVMLDLMKEITGEKPKMWGSSIVGFSTYQYKYKSGREGDFFITALFP